MTVTGRSVTAPSNSGSFGPAPASTPASTSASSSPAAGSPLRSLTAGPGSYGGAAVTPSPVSVGSKMPSPLRRLLPSLFSGRR